ncbi:MAG: hypothetical protein L0387_41645 [Acidobacteria bacterium]|nr:hypothetical protein [Acidobacteriota bacterium]MCI0628093.1 hypothetical protein [Acidobacteriota bacterium]MCI0721003.1 hypothetical protein [Acidobacteriota bacterium]
MAVDLSAEQYRAGLADFLSVLDAQRELYSSNRPTLAWVAGLVSSLIASVMKS